MDDDFNNIDNNKHNTNEKDLNNILNIPIDNYENFDTFLKELNSEKRHNLLPLFSKYVINNNIKFSDEI